MATKAKLKITTSWTDESGALQPPKPILDNFCLSSPDTSKVAKKDSAAWQTLVSALKATRWQPFNGSPMAHVRYIDQGSDCYNIDPLIEAKRKPPLTVAQINNGICVRKYGYGFWQDTLGYLPKLNPIPQVIPAINIVEPILRGFYTTTFQQIDFIISSCAAAGIEIGGWVLGEESGLYEDVFPTSAGIKTATQTIEAYIHSKRPGDWISGDANIVTDATMRLKDLNAVLNTLTGVTRFRQYFQKYDSTYAAARTRITGFANFCDEFQRQFPGKKMRIEQAVVKAGLETGQPNPLKGTVGEGLIYCEEIINGVIKENMKRGNLIDEYYGEVGRFVNDQSFIALAPYLFMVLIRGAWQNDGAITPTFIDAPGSDELITLAVKKGAGVEMYIVNPTSLDISLESVKVDSFKKQVDVQAYYARDPMQVLATSYTYHGPAPVIHSYSLTKISSPG